MAKMVPSSWAEGALRDAACSLGGAEGPWKLSLHYTRETRWLGGGSHVKEDVNSCLASPSLEWPLLPLCYLAALRSDWAEPVEDKQGRGGPHPAIQQNIRDLTGEGCVNQDGRLLQHALEIL